MGEKRSSLSWKFHLLITVVMEIFLITPEIQTANMSYMNDDLIDKIQTQKDSNEPHNASSHSVSDFWLDWQVWKGQDLGGGGTLFSFCSFPVCAYSVVLSARMIYVLDPGWYCERTFFKLLLLRVMFCCVFTQGDVLGGLGCRGQDRTSQLWRQWQKEGGQLLSSPGQRLGFGHCK